MSQSATRRFERREKQAAHRFLVRQRPDPNALELFDRDSGPSVVEGGFASDCGDADGAALLDNGLERWRNVKKDKRVKRQYIVATRYALRRGIQDLCDELPKSVRHCGSQRPAAGGVKIARNGSGHAVWLGLNRCGNPRACPVCSARTTAERRDELLEAFGLAREFGWAALSVALTVRHGIGDDAGKLARLLSLAYRFCFNKHALKTLLKGLGYQGPIRIVEVNYSAENGYHPHLHVLMFFDREITRLDAVRVEAELFHAWVLAVNDARIRVGLDCGLPDALHGVHVELLDLSRGPEYFVKVGLVTELLGEFYKHGRRDTWTMWEVARDMVVNHRHGLTQRAAEAADIWMGYVRAMKHFKSYFVATRLRRKLMRPMQLELDVRDQRAEPVVVYSFGDDEYRTVRRAGPVALAAVDGMAESGQGAEAIRRYLEQLAEHFSDQDDRERCRDPVPFAVHEPLTPLELQSLHDVVYGSGTSLDRTGRMLASYDPDQVFDRVLAAA